MSDVIIVAGGASILEGVETGLWDKIRDKEIWSLNFAFKAMPYSPNRELWVDTTFWKNNIAELEALHKIGVACHCRKNDRYNGIPDIIQHATSREPNNTNNLYIGGMGLCGMFALSLAVREQRNPIYLLGYDWGTNRLGDTQTHFYQGMSGVSYQSSGVGRREVYIQDNNNPKRDVNDFNVYGGYKEIYNVSMRSHINTFPKLSYEEFYGRIKT